MSQQLLFENLTKTNYGGIARLKHGIKMSYAYHKEQFILFVAFFMITIIFVLTPILHIKLGDATALILDVVGFVILLMFCAPVLLIISLWNNRGLEIEILDSDGSYQTDMHHQDVVIGAKVIDETLANFHKIIIYVYENAADEMNITPALERMYTKIKNKEISELDYMHQFAKEQHYELSNTKDCVVLKRELATQYQARLKLIKNIKTKEDLEKVLSQPPLWFPRIDVEQSMINLLATLNKTVSYGSLNSKGWKVLALFLRNGFTLMDEPKKRFKLLLIAFKPSEYEIINSNNWDQLFVKCRRFFVTGFGYGKPNNILKANLQIIDSWHGTPLMVLENRKVHEIPILKRETDDMKIVAESWFAEVYIKVNEQLENEVKTKQRLIDETGAKGMMYYIEDDRTARRIERADHPTKRRTIWGSIAIGFLLGVCTMMLLQMLFPAKPIVVTTNSTLTTVLHLLKVIYPW